MDYKTETDWLFLCTYLCEQVHVSMDVYADNTIFFLRQCFSLSWNTSWSLGCLPGQGAPGILSACLVGGLQEYIHLAFFTQVLGIELGSLYFQSKRFTNLAIAPALKWIIEQLWGHLEQTTTTESPLWRVPEFFRNKLVLLPTQENGARECRSLVPVQILFLRGLSREAGETFLFFIDRALM